MQPWKKYEVGFTGCYINDHSKFWVVCEIPAEVAIAWTQERTPNSRTGACGELAKDIDMLCNRVNGWLNKLFVIIEQHGDEFIAIYKHDFKFYIYKTRINN